MAITGLDGTGTTITFAGSSFAAKLISVDGPSMERDAIDATHMATTTAKEFIVAELHDGGSVDLTFEHLGTLDPPIGEATESITINWSGVGAGSQWRFDGFMTGYSPSAAIGERMEATATLKLTGDIAIV